MHYQLNQSAKCTERKAISVENQKVLPHASEDRKKDVEYYHRHSQSPEEKTNYVAGKIMHFS